MEKHHIGWFKSMQPTWLQLTI